MKINRAHVSILGGFLLFMNISSTYIYGVLFPYLSSYLRNVSNSTITTKEVDIIILLDTFSQGIFVMLTAKFQSRFNERSYCFFVSVIYAAMWLLASLMKNPFLAIFFYGIGVGSAKGCFYLIPIYNAYRLFPNNKGKAAGIVFSGFAAGPLLWNSLLFQLTNPHNLEPQYDSRVKEEFFSNEVTNNLPGAIQILSLLQLFVGLIGSLLLADSRFIEMQKNESDFPNQNSKQGEFIA